MTMYLTKVWGFSEPCGPLQFSTGWWRDRARAELSAGDLVVLVGTKVLPTPEGERGRVLGMMEPTREPVLSLDFELDPAPHDYTETGEYRWPHGLLNRHAWRLLDRPLLTEISSRRFHMDAALGIVPLTDEEADRILRLRREEVQLLTSIRSVARIEGQEVAQRRGAPAPTTTRTGVMHLRRAPAYTYAMEIQGARSSAFKIGWTFNHKARVRQFNLYAMPQIGGLLYRVSLTELWDTARQAFTMEQYLLKSFDRWRHPANREVIQGLSFNELRSSWGDCVQRLRFKR